MRTIKLYSEQTEQYKDGEVVVFRVRKENVEGHDKTILEETS